MASFKERCDARVFVKPNVRYYVYRGKEHDLYIELPDYTKLQRCFEIIFDKEGKEPPYIKIHKKTYVLDTPPLLTEDRGYYCIHGKFEGSKGLHKIPLHRLAYTAFYGVPPVGYHIHHIDRNKHNNAADNLVALTEEEHSIVHGRDVSVPRNIFTKQQPKRNLLQPKTPEALDRIASINDYERAKRQEKEAESSVTLSYGVSGLLRFQALEQERSELYDDAAIRDPIVQSIEDSLTEPKVLRLLLEEYTPERLKKLVDVVLRTRLPDATSQTVLEFLCREHKSRKDN